MATTTTSATLVGYSCTSVWLASVDPDCPGSILICGLAIVLTLALLVLTEKRKASVGRREMQLFLIGYIIISIAEIFSIGGFPLQRKALLVFSAIHVAAVTATAWVLMLNGFVAFQYLDDGTVVSIALVLGSAAVLFIGTGYIALDTGFSWTGYFSSSLSPPNRNTGLYVLYLLCTLIFLFVFFIIMAFIVLRTLGERGPMGE